MSGCFSFSATQDTCYRKSFNKSGLRSTTTDLGNGTVVHCWAPKDHTLSKPTLLMIHGFGANAMWQFNNFLPSLIPHFNLYVPDLLFFGDSFTTRPARSEVFQADCVFSLMDSLLERRVGGFHVFGISYGGFVAYRIAERHPGRVGRVLLACTGVCLEERDMEVGFFRVKSVEEAVGILLPQTPEKLRELMKLSFYKPPPRAPSCFLNDFVEALF